MGLMRLDPWSLTTTRGNQLIEKNGASIGTAALGSRRARRKGVRSALAPVSSRGFCAPKQSSRHRPHPAYSEALGSCAAARLPRREVTSTQASAGGGAGTGGSDTISGSDATGGKSAAAAAAAAIGSSSFA